MLFPSKVLCRVKWYLGGKAKCPEWDESNYHREQFTMQTTRVNTFAFGGVLPVWAWGYWSRIGSSRRQSNLLHLEGQLKRHLICKNRLLLGLEQRQLVLRNVAFRQIIHFIDWRSQFTDARGVVANWLCIQIRMTLGYGKFIYRWRKHTLTNAQIIPMQGWVWNRCWMQIPRPGKWLFRGNQYDRF